MADCLPNLNKSMSLTTQVSHITQQMLNHQQDDDQQKDDILRAVPLTRIYTNRRLSQKLSCWRTI
jgi:hypothetical protein